MFWPSFFQRKRVQETEMHTELRDFLVFMLERIKDKHIPLRNLQHWVKTNNSVWKFPPFTGASLSKMCLMQVCGGELALAWHFCQWKNKILSPSLGTEVLCSKARQCLQEFWRISEAAHTDSGEPTNKSQESTTHTDWPVGNALKVAERKSSKAGH